MSVANYWWGPVSEGKSGNLVNLGMMLDRKHGLACFVHHSCPEQCEWLWVSTFEIHCERIMCLLAAVSAHQIYSTIDFLIRLFWQWHTHAHWFSSHKLRWWTINDHKFSARLASLKATDPSLIIKAAKLQCKTFAGQHSLPWCSLSRHPQHSRKFLLPVQRGLRMLVALTLAIRHCCYTVRSQELSMRVEGKA